MLPFLNAKQLKVLDAETVATQNITSNELMERAALAFCEVLLKKQIDLNNSFHIFCGTGNNGGDGLAVARILFQKGYKITVYTPKEPLFSDDALINWNKLIALNGVGLKNWEDAFATKFCGSCFIIDALFGTGLSKPLSGLVKKLVQHLNLQQGIKISLDIPSGVHTNQNFKDDWVAFAAHYTISFQLPKLCFMLAEYEFYIGKWILVNIGLNPTRNLEAASEYFLIEEQDVFEKLKWRNRFAHKGTQGHVGIVGGSMGKAGAIILSAKAALHSGCGLVSCYIPSALLSIIQTAFPPSMCMVDEGSNFLTKYNSAISFSAMAVGMGMGTEQKSCVALKMMLKKATCPLVFDADALNLLSEHKSLISKIPANSILTPHPKEFERLFGKTKNSYERLDLLRSNAKKLHLIIVLKGAYTAIALPNGKIYFNSNGNSGMATAGSGDVLSGIIAGLLAQGYKAEDAALIGVYIHALAGDIAAKKQSQNYITAEEIILALSDVFRLFEEKKKETQLF